MLEETKHLFDINGLVFIIATDAAQLAHSVCAIYGQNFESSRYLLRFFDRRYMFEKTTIEDFVRSMFEFHSDLQRILATPLETDPVSCFAGIMEHFGLSLRDTERCFDILRSFVSMWEKNVAVQLAFVAPLIALFHLGRMEEFAQLAQMTLNDPKGKGSP
jgi:hypothetical protein